VWGYGARGRKPPRGTEAAVLRGAFVRRRTRCWGPAAAERGNRGRSSIGGVVAANLRAAPPNPTRRRWCVLIPGSTRPPGGVFPGGEGRVSCDRRGDRRIALASTAPGQGEETAPSGCRSAKITGGVAVRPRGPSSTRLEGFRRALWTSGGRSGGVRRGSGLGGLLIIYVVARRRAVPSEAQGRLVGWGAGVQGGLTGPMAANWESPAGR